MAQSIARTFGVRHTLRLARAWLTALLVAPVAAAPVTLELPYASYGQVENVCVPGTAPKGVCAAAAMVNSFEYLRRQFPSLYAGLIPDSNADQQIDLVDLRAARDRLALGSWGGNNEFKGIYARPGGLEDLWNAKLDWFNTFAPRHTVFEGEVNTAIDLFTLTGALSGSRVFSGFPSFDFLKSAVRQRQDVEVAFKDPTGGQGINHAVTVTGVVFDPDNAQVMSMIYLDSNDPANKKTADLTAAAGGGLRFTLNGKVEELYLAFAESAVPEPASWGLTALAAVALVLSRRRPGALAARQAPA